MYSTIETIIGYTLGVATIALIAPLAYFWVRAMLQVVGII